MSTISPISFQGRLAQTKKGNLYEKTNTGKNIGTVAGLIGGTVIGTSGVAQFGVAAAITKYLPKIASSNKLFWAIGAGVVGIIGAVTLVGRALGAIPDAIINGLRKKKADVKAENPAPVQPKTEPEKV